MNLLLLEPDLRLARALAASIGDRGRVYDLSRREEALALAAEGRLHAVFGEATYLPDMAELRALGVPCALWTSRSVDDLVLAARAASVSVLVSKTHPVLLEELLLAADSWRHGLRRGVGKYLSSDWESLGELSVSHADEVGDACREVLASLDPAMRGNRRLRLVLDELMTNSLHHGGGVPARVEWGRDGVRHAFVVRDAAGRLEPDEALRLLDRHLHGEGLQDPRGRGLHLSRIYADRLYVSVVPERMTESAAIFWNRPGTFQGFKPIWILSTDRTKED